MGQPLHPSYPFRGGAKFSPPMVASAGLYQEATDHRDLNPNVDLRNYQGQSLCPPIVNQGRYSCCTAAAGHYVRLALAAKYHIDRGESPARGDVPSMRYIYYHIRQIDGTLPKDEGASMQAACQVYRDYGASPDTYDPWDDARAMADDTAWLNKAPSKAAEAAAQSYGISGFGRLSGTGSSLLASILTVLNQHRPCQIAWNVYPSAESQVGSDGRIPMPGRTEHALGGHDTAVFGSFADNSFAGGGCLVIPQSWGTLFGADGWVYMPWAAVLDAAPYSNLPMVQESWDMW